MVAYVCERGRGVEGLCDAQESEVADSERLLEKEEV
jgi:hypothetical protein